MNLYDKLLDDLIKSIEVDPTATKNLVEEFLDIDFGKPPYKCKPDHYDIAKEMIQKQSDAIVPFNKLYNSCIVKYSYMEISEYCYLKWDDWDVGINYLHKLIDIKLIDKRLLTTIFSNKFATVISKCSIPTIVKCIDYINESCWHAGEIVKTFYEHHNAEIFKHFDIEQMDWSRHLVNMCNDDRGGSICKDLIAADILNVTRLNHVLSFANRNDIEIDIKTLLPNKSRLELCKLIMKYEDFNLIDFRIDDLEEFKIVITKNYNITPEQYNTIEINFYISHYELNELFVSKDNEGCVNTLYKHYQIYKGLDVNNIIIREFIMKYPECYKLFNYTMDDNEIINALSKQPHLYKQLHEEYCITDGMLDKVFDIDGFCWSIISHIPNDRRTDKMKLKCFDSLLSSWQCNNCY